MPHKTYVLDTSVLLADPNALFTFDEHQVVVPLVVIKELEAKRHDPLLGYYARTALRSLDELSERPNADIASGVNVNDTGGTVRIEINHVDTTDLPDAMRTRVDNDTRILAVAKNLAAEGRDVVVVSKDMPLRLLAKAVGLGSEQYLNEQVHVDKPYTGIDTIDVEQDIIDTLYADGEIDIALVSEAFGATPAITNTGIEVRGPGGTCVAYIRSDGGTQTLTRVDTSTEPFGIKGRSLEQRIGLHHLNNPDVGIVSLGGKAGTGKTFLALASGLEQVLEQGLYKKVIVFRPLYAVGGQDLGFLPGTFEEKMGPWAGAVYDALGSMGSQTLVEEIMARGLLEVLPLTHIRGRTLNDAYVIVDEAQNLEKSVLLTAMSRLGESSKIVLAHDTAQRDNLHVGRYDGIHAVVERLKGERLFAHTTFSRSERGPVAELVTRLLDDA